MVEAGVAQMFGITGRKLVRAGKVGFRAHVDIVVLRCVENGIDR